MDDDYVKQLGKYFEARDDKIDNTLNTLLGSLRDKIVHASGRDRDALDVLTNTILVTAIHLSRKGAANDLKLRGFPALLSAFEKIPRLYESLLKVRENIKEVHNLYIPWTSILPRRLIGFDPRYPPNDAEEVWGKIIEEITKKKPTDSDLSMLPTHQDAKHKIYLDFHDPSTRYDLLLVDFAWLPELAYQGHVLPVDLFIPDIETLIRRKIVAAIGGNLHDKRVRRWEYVLRHLASAGNDRYYAFPILLNFHTFLRHKETDDKNEKLEVELGKCMSAVQDAQTACLVYELYSHFAYHGVRPIECKGNGMEFQIVLNLPSNREEMTERKASLAIIDYLTRLKLSHPLIKGFADPFTIDHFKLVDLLNKGKDYDGLGFDACVSFPIELLGNLNLTKYPDPGEPFSNPLDIKGKKDNHFLTSLGGYGLAISRQANDHGRAAQLAYSLFEKGNSLDFKKICTLLPLERVTHIDRFVDYHCRPRIPFWSHIEEILFDAIEGFSNIVPDIIIGTSFQEAKLIVINSLKTVDAFKAMESLRKRLKMAFINNGWKVNDSGDE